MGKDHKGERGTTTGASITSTRVAENDRVCSQCRLALPWTGDGGALEACWCPFCERRVKPEYRGPHDRAVAFRDTLRGLVMLEKVPEQVLEEIRTCWDRRIWTSLFGSDCRPFKTFDDFCRDPMGLGCEPAPIKALLTEWVGAAAFALATTPVAQQGRRTDRLAGTSRQNGEKSRPSRTDSRHRKIHRGPQVLVDAVGSRILGKMNAEFLARYAAENPRCTLLAEILRQLEEGVAKPKAEHTAIRAAISGRVNALKGGTPSPSRRGAKKRNELPTPSVAAKNRASGTDMSTTVRLPSARADRNEAVPTGPVDMLSLPEATGEGQSAALRLPVVAGDHGQSADGAPELQVVFADLLRAWRRIVAVIGGDLELSIWLELLQAATVHDGGIDDDDLYALLATHLRVPRAMGSLSVSEELVPAGSLSTLTMRHEGGDPWAMAHLAPAAE
jgi:hypothetical protein